MHAGFRVGTAAVSSLTGVDAAGLLTVKKFDGRKVPAYATLLVCSLSRADGLELVENLTTYEFLFAVRRFYNRHPTVTSFFPDNAASFRRAVEEIKLLHDLAKRADTQGFLSKHRIDWNFCTERSPWRNGFTELMVSRRLES